MAWLSRCQALLLLMLTLCWLEVDIETEKKVILQVDIEMLKVTNQCQCPGYRCVFKCLYHSHCPVSGHSNVFIRVAALALARNI